VGQATLNQQEARHAQQASMCASHDDFVNLDAYEVGIGISSLKSISSVVVLCMFSCWNSFALLTTFTLFGQPSVPLTGCRTSKRASEMAAAGKGAATGVAPAHEFQWVKTV
jgi:hypothetical protein